MGPQWTPLVAENEGPEGFRQLQRQFDDEDRDRRQAKAKVKAKAAEKAKTGAATKAEPKAESKAKAKARGKAAAAERPAAIEVIDLEDPGSAPPTQPPPIAQPKGGADQRPTQKQIMTDYHKAMAAAKFIRQSGEYQLTPAAIKPRCSRQRYKVRLQW